VTLGPPTLLNVDSISATNVRWTGRAGTVANSYFAQVRAHGDPVQAVLTAIEGDGDDAAMTVELAEPIRGVAPGQSLVIYDGQRVVGSGTISSTGSLSRASPR
jgi:tRNA-specific 2-thiouridylase